MINVEHTGISAVAYNPLTPETVLISTKLETWGSLSPNSHSGSPPTEADIMSVAVTCFSWFLHVATRRTSADPRFVFAIMSIDEDEGFSDNPDLTPPRPHHPGFVRTSAAAGLNANIESSQPVMDVSHLDRAQKGGEYGQQCHFRHI